VFNAVDRGEGERLEPGGAGLGVADEEDVGRPRLEPRACGGDPRDHWFGHPEAAVLPEWERRAPCLERERGDHRLGHDVVVVVGRRGH
jgi:hypothetical protein